MTWDQVFYAIAGAVIFGVGRLICSFGYFG